MGSVRVGDPVEWGQNLHCVAYSFRRIEDLIRQSPASAILCSRGVSFLRLPFDPAALDLEVLAAQRAKPEELRSFLRGGLLLPDERHDWANWYAAWQTSRLYGFETGSKTLVADDLSPAGEGYVRDFLYLYGTPADLQREAWSRRRKLGKSREKLRRRTGAGRSDGDPQPVLQIALLDDEAVSLGGGSSFGWQEIYTRVLFGEQAVPVGSRVVDVLREVGLEQREFEVDDLIQGCKELDLGRYALLLLDLRLKGERGPVADATAFSGARVLSAVRASWPGLPVLVTTASSRAAAYEALMRLGADGYWVKRGLEERATASDLVDGYQRLIELAATLTGDEFQFLRRFATAYGDLKSRLHDGRPLWWRDSDCEGWYRHESLVDRDLRIVEMLGELTVMLREYLQRWVLDRGSPVAPEDRGSSWAAAMVQHGGKIIEAIHAFDLLPEEKRHGGTIGRFRDRTTNSEEGRHDWFGYGLRALRNQAAHFGPTRVLPWAEIEDFLAWLMCYVSLGPEGMEKDQRLFDQGGEREALADMVASNYVYNTMYRRLCGRGPGLP